MGGLSWPQAGVQLQGRIQRVDEGGASRHTGKVPLLGFTCFHQRMRVNFGILGFGERVQLPKRGVFDKHRLH